MKFGPSRASSRNTVLYRCALPLLTIGDAGGRASRCAAGYDENSSDATADAVIVNTARQRATFTLRVSPVTPVKRNGNAAQSLFLTTGVIDGQRVILRAISSIDCVEKRMKTTRTAAVILLVATTMLAAEVMKRGAAVSSSKPVALATVLASPKAYTKAPVVVEGVIEKACTAAGCWMELAPASGKKSIRVIFKDEEFAIPLTAKGMQARAEGVTKVHTLSKAEADHLSGEGATLTRNEDGTADEVSFIATGVELTRPE